MSTCACIRIDRHDCWRARYSLPMCESIEADGGPCECACHDDEEAELDAEWGAAEHAPES